MTRGARDIARERERQMRREGWDARHDDEHQQGELALAAACYATGRPTKVRIEFVPPCSCRSVDECYHWTPVKRWRDAWPWDKKWDKREKHDRRRQLVIAGALIAAEIDRLDRERRRAT